LACFGCFFQVRLFQPVYLRCCCPVALRRVPVESSPSCANARRRFSLSGFGYGNGYGLVFLRSKTTSACFWLFLVTGIKIRTYQKRFLLHFSGLPFCYFRRSFSRVCFLSLPALPDSSFFGPTLAVFPSIYTNYTFLLVKIHKNVPNCRLWFCKNGKNNKRVMVNRHCVWRTCYAPSLQAKPSQPRHCERSAAIQPFALRSDITSGCLPATLAGYVQAVGLPRFARNDGARLRVAPYET